MVPVSLAPQTSVFFPCRSETTKFSVLVNRVDEPVNSWVISDSRMGDINQNDLKIFEGGILLSKQKESVRSTRKNFIAKIN